MEIHSGQSVRPVNSVSGNGSQLTAKQQAEKPAFEAKVSQEASGSSVIDTITSTVSSFVKGLNFASRCVNGYVFKMAKAFDPFLSFVNKIDTPGGENKITAKELSEEFENSFSKLNNVMGKISNENKTKLLELDTVLTRLSQRQDISSDKITELIKKWRENKNTQDLYVLVEHLKSHKGKCADLETEKAKQLLGNTLDTLLKALEEIDSHPVSPDQQRAKQEVVGAIDTQVGNAEALEKAGSISKMSPDEKKKLVENEKKCQRHIHNLTEDPALKPFVSNSLDLLRQIQLEITEFWDEYYEQVEKEEKERACEERCEMKKEIEKLCRKYEIKKSEAEKIYIVMLRAKRKLQELLYLKDEYEKHLSLSHKQYEFLKHKIEKYSGIYSFFDGKYENAKSAEYYYMAKEGNLDDMLPPESVCEDDKVSLNLNVIC